MMYDPAKYQVRSIDRDSPPHAAGREPTRCGGLAVACAQRPPRSRLRAALVDEIEMSEMNKEMHEMRGHTTYKEQLRPTPQQEQALECVLWRCRTRYTTALEQRSTAWERCHVSVSRFQQEAELQDLRA